MEKYIWNYDDDLQDKDVVNLAISANIDLSIARLLINRGVDTKSKVHKFLNPSIFEISDPYGLKDMEKAVARIERAISKGESIWIYGDYDVDGTTSTSLFILALRELGIEANFYIPLREEGYGVSKAGISTIKKEGGNLVITVDCGITSISEVEYANSIGLDVIVTDHHTLGDSIPAAVAVINPKREENRYKFELLAGVGTSFMVIYALFKARLMNISKLWDFMDIVALGTIADMVPLVEENRIFVKRGLETIVHSSNLGLSILVNEVLGDKVAIDTTTISFRIAPIFNAAGRMENAASIVELLISKDRDECKKLVSHLLSLNKKRQKIGKEIMERAEKQILDKDLNGKGALVVSSEDFHQGVIGIAASKLCKKYGKVSMVISIKDDGTAVGSARSLEDTDLMVIFDGVKELLIKFGGHRQAAGFTIDESNLEKFAEVVEDLLSKEHKKYIPCISIDSEIYDFNASLEFYRKLKLLTPFGVGNQEPVFLFKGVKIKNKRLIGKDKNHLMFDIYTENRILKNCPFFGAGEKHDLLSEESRYDVLFKMGSNVYKNNNYLKIYIEDIKLNSQWPGIRNSFYRELFHTSFPLVTEVDVDSSRLRVGDSLELETIIGRNNNFLKKDGVKYGSLGGELTYLLESLSQNFNFRFSSKILNITPQDGRARLTLVIDRCFDIRSSSNEKELLNEIKHIVIGEKGYNSMQKQVLREAIINEKDVLLIAEKGRGIKSLALSIAMFHFAKLGRKSLFVSKEKILDDKIKQYFDLSRKYKKGDYPFIFFYETQLIDCDGKFLSFHQKGVEIEEIGRQCTKIMDGCSIPDNVTIVDEEGPGVYSRFISKQEREKIGERLKSKDEVLAKREIKSIL